MSEHASEFTDASRRALTVRRAITLCSMLMVSAAGACRLGPRYVRPDAPAPQVYPAEYSQDST